MMSATASQEVRQPAATPRPRTARQPRLIRQASAWLPHRAPEPLPLQDLEYSEGIRWVDIYGGVLGISEVLALLAPVCDGELTAKMVRDLITPKRFATGGCYRNSEVVITSGFRIRHLHSDAHGGGPANGNGAANGSRVASVFEPVQLLVGDDWLLSCWHPPRVFRGLSEPVHVADDSSSGLYLSVAEGWQTSGATNAAGLAKLVRRELAVAAGYRPPIN